MPTSGRMRTYQILMFMVSGTAGLVVSIAVGWTSRILQGQCVLFSDMSIVRLVNGSLALTTDKSKWGHPLDCSFGTFCPVGVTIYCVIWTWFYIFLSDWGTTFIEDKTEQKESDTDRPPPDQHLLIPSIACNILVLGLLFATVAIVEAGRSEWCENIQASLKESCSFVSGKTWQNLKGGKDIYRYLTHARVASWVLLGSMIIQTIIIFIRLRRNSRLGRRDSIITDYLSSDSDFTEDEEDIIPVRKRGIYRQRVVLVEPEFQSSSEDVRNDPSSALLEDLDFIDEYREQPA